MSSTPIANIGDKSADGAVLTASFSVQPNDAHNVALNPEQGRFLMTAPDGYQYTTIASSTVQPSASTTVTFLKDAK